MGTQDMIFNTRRFAEMMKAVASCGIELPLSVIREIILPLFEQCNHCLYFDDTTKDCPQCRERTVCRSCGTDGIQFHDCKPSSYSSENGQRRAQHESVAH